MTKEEQYGFLPATGDYSNTRNQTLPYGGELMSADGTASLLEDDAVKEGLRWVHDQFFTHKVAPTAQEMQGSGRTVDQMFLAKQLIVFQSGGWSLNTLVTAVGDQFAWDMVLMAKGPAGVRGGHLHVDAEAVTEQSQHKELAYTFAKYLTDKEGGVGIASENGLAARPDVYADERITANPHLITLGQSVAEAAEHINPANLRKQELQTTINAIFTPLWLGDVEFSDDFFAQASQEFQEFLDKPAE
jgi:ABC-type glycerol-3-phosphate transport system substrate-binding protein